MTGTAWAGRRLFGFKKDSIPLNMPYGFIKKFIILDKVIHQIEPHIFKIEDDYFKTHGFTMHFAEVLEELEKLRAKDCDNYIFNMNNQTASVPITPLPHQNEKKQKEVIFHENFRSKNCK